MPQTLDQLQVRTTFYDPIEMELDLFGDLGGPAEEEQQLAMAGIFSAHQATLPNEVLTITPLL